MVDTGLTMLSTRPNVLLASLNYLKNDVKYKTEKPYICVLDLGDVPEAESTNVILETTSDVEVENVRDQWQDFSLAKQGFQLVRSASAFKISDFDDPNWIKEFYYPYSCKLLIKILGAKKAHVFEHAVRKALILKFESYRD